MDVANGDVFTYCFLKHFLTFSCLPPEWEQQCSEPGLLEWHSQSGTISAEIWWGETNPCPAQLQGSQNGDFASALAAKCSRAVLSGSHEHLGCPGSTQGCSSCQLRSSLGWRGKPQTPEFGMERHARAQSCSWLMLPGHVLGPSPGNFWGWTDQEEG